MLKHKHKYKVTYTRYTSDGRVKIETLIMYGSTAGECRQRISDIEEIEYPGARIVFGIIKLLGRAR